MARDASDVAALLEEGIEKTGLPGMSVSLGQEHAESAVDGVGTDFQLEWTPSAGTKVGMGAPENAGAKFYQLGAHARFDLASIGRVEGLEYDAPYRYLSVDGHLRSDADGSVDESVESRHADKADLVPARRPWPRNQGATIREALAGESNGSTVCPVSRPGFPGLPPINETNEDHEIFDVLSKPAFGRQGGGIHDRLPAIGFVDREYNLS